MLQSRIAFPLIFALFAVAGCSSGPVNTTNPSTSDLLFRWDELSAYLDQRRGELDRVQNELVEVNQRLTGVLRALGDENETVDALRGDQALSASQVAQLKYEVGQLEGQATQVRTRLVSAQREKAALEGQNLEQLSQSRADNQRVIQLKSEIVELERQVVVLERNLDRYRETRKRAALRG